ncbi:MAG TPA: hypothetical protein VJT31_28950 [Rugosimonospora sp.]|nr:hypothetical protein [Rugosimonospora sp.]
MGRREQRAEIQGLAKEIIGAVAPEDLPFLDDQAEGYFAHRRRFRRGGRGDIPNAFDAAAVAAALAVVVLKILERVFDASVNTAVETVWERILRWVAGRSPTHRIEAAELDAVIAEELEAHKVAPERAAELTAAIKSAVMRHFDLKRRPDGSD